MGLGSQWSTTPFMKNLGFNVITSNNYRGLFKMLGAKRFELFPRSISEILGEYETKKDVFKFLTIEKTQALYYPLPKFFFYFKEVS